MPEEQVPQDKPSLTQTSRPAPRTAWKPGTSGNPGGKSAQAQRAKAEADLARARILENLTAYVDAHNSTLLQMDELILTCETPFELAKLMAIRKNIELCMSYIISKPKQELDVTSAGEPIVFVRPPITNNPDIREQGADLP
jgi:hypothetical protein